jgi:hypothetical protein
VMITALQNTGANGGHLPVSWTIHGHAA